MNALLLSILGLLAKEKEYRVEKIRIRIDFFMVMINDICIFMINQRLLIYSSKGRYCFLIKTQIFHNFAQKS